MEREPVRKIEDPQRIRYLVAVEAVAEWLLATLDASDADSEEYLESAEAALRALQRDGHSEHAWIFRDPSVLQASEHLFDALDERPDGGRDWLHADLASAVSAVARYDVMTILVDRVAEWVDEGEAADGVTLEEGEA
jgi:hypothetical protein